MKNTFWPIRVRMNFITLMMVAVCTSETSVHFNGTTQHYNPEDSKVHYIKIITILRDFEVWNQAVN
jgi:hypothetical protein